MLYLEHISLRIARWVFVGPSKNLALVAKKLQFHCIINFWRSYASTEIEHVEIKNLSPIVPNETLLFTQIE